LPTQASLETLLEYPPEKRFLVDFRAWGKGEYLAEASYQEWVEGWVEGFQEVWAEAFRREE
jgi:hypothetical protein